MNGRVTTLLTMLAAATVMLSTIGAQPATRYIWNASESVPVGLYLVRPPPDPPSPNSSSSNRQNPSQHSLRKAAICRVAFPC